MLVCNDPKLLPVIYHRRADKTNHYSPGGFGKTPGIFNVQLHAEHAAARKLIAQPVIPAPCYPDNIQSSDGAVVHIVGCQTHGKPLRQPRRQVDRGAGP